MKNSKLLTYLLLVSLSILFVQCTSEYEAIQGPPGADGIDGVDGIAGTDAEATCVACHSNSHRDPINDSFFNFSTHGTSFVSFAAGRGGDDPTNRCAQCHSEEGYIDYITMGESAEEGYDDPSRFSCTTCHDKHSTFDFANDGDDFALRTFDPVQLVLDSSVFLDFGNTSNSCITCHQPRSTYPIPADDGSGVYEVTSSRFGPHHGPQSTMLEGILAANIPGAEGYPGVASSTHRQESSCTQCHMAPSNNTIVGLHSWKIVDRETVPPTNISNGIITSNACTSCHPNGAPEEIAGFSEDMAKLKQLLNDIGIIVDLPNDNDRSTEGTYPVKQAQAAWNYMTLLEDNSRGIHNPAYTKALLKNSIEALEND